MTTYVVLRLIDGDPQSNGEDWLVVETSIEARDDKHAIQQASKEAGTFVAVPIRSWTPRTRQTETVVKDIWT